MKKNLIKAAILCAVFVGTILIISRMTNKENTDLTTEMAEATLPLLHLEWEGNRLGSLRGYVNEMNPVFMRDAIIPVNSSGQLQLTVEDFGHPIDSASYELMAIDAGTPLEENSIPGLEKQGDMVNAALQLQKPLEQGVEYILKIALKTEGRTVSYYTRVISDGDLRVGKTLDFVRNFHAKTFDKSQARELVPWLEPDATGDNSSFGAVNIHSSFEQITWGALTVHVKEEPWISFKELNAYGASATLGYVVGIDTESGENYYNVEEFYRLRCEEKETYLIDYERRMNQIFALGDDTFSSRSIYLGIRDGDVEYMSNESNTIVCFVQEGELWSYNTAARRLTRVFSFRSGDLLDDRSNYREHELRIIRVDETGSTDFVVSGYMNRGIHEGQTGILVCHYNSVTNSLEEQAFIPSDKSFQAMKGELGNLLYINSNNYLYVMLGGSVYEVNLTDRTFGSLITGLTEGAYVISDNGRSLAWQEEKDIYRSRTIKRMDFDTRQNATLQVEEGEYIYPIGFMGEDFIYGLCQEGDMEHDQAGNILFPMYKIMIVGSQNELLREYSQPGFYIKAARIEDNVIKLDRITKAPAGGYAEGAGDTIVYSSEAKEGGIAVTAIITETMKKQIRIDFPGEIAEKAPKLMTPKEVLFEESRDIALAPGGSGLPMYYAYARGAMQLGTENISEAIALASAQGGVVVDQRQRYVWERGRRPESAEVALVERNTGTRGEAGSVAACLQAILTKLGSSADAEAMLAEGKSAAEILGSLGKVRAMDLKGVRLTDLFYYLGRGSVVLGMKAPDQPVLIVAYDIFNITMVDPAAGTTEKMAIDDATEFFQKSGNVFLSYIL